MNNVTVESGCLLLQCMQSPRARYALTGVKLLLGVEIVPMLFTILANAILVLAIVRTKKLWTPCNTLLGALCVSDLLVGIVSHPLLIAVLIKAQSNQHLSIGLRILLLSSNVIFNGMSFINVLYITVDRYVAICHPFWYHAKVTCKGYVILMVITWLYKIVPLALGTKFYLVYYPIFSVVSFAVILLCYKKIYSVIRRQKRDIQKLGTFGEAEKKVLHQSKEEQSKAYTIAIMLLVLLISYVPILAVSLTAFSKEKKARICSLSPSMFVALMWAIFFVNLTSLVNPLVYCIRMKQIKLAAYKLMFPSKNRVLVM